MVKDFPLDRLHLKSNVNSLMPTKDGGVTLSTDKGPENFDHVVFAHLAIRLQMSATDPQQKWRGRR